MLFLTETSTPVVDEATTEVAKEAFNLANHIANNWEAYVAIAAFAVLGIAFYFIKKASDRADRLAKRKMK